ncbi:MAG TPA: hypothetical protein DCZ44_05850 [Flavobacteriaceae bacterium]|nr:hypothetical protein [Flavobacteriaceae bacterium]
MNRDEAFKKMKYKRINIKAVQHLNWRLKTRKAISSYEYFDMAPCESSRYQLIFTIQGRFIKPPQLWLAF